MAKRLIKTQMPSTAVPSQSGGSNAINQYKCPPFAAHKHDVGTGGIPTTVETKMPVKMPSGNAPAFSSPNGPSGAPKPGTRRY